MKFKIYDRELIYDENRIKRIQDIQRQYAFYYEPSSTLEEEICWMALYAVDEKDATKTEELATTLKRFFKEETFRFVSGSSRLRGDAFTEKGLDLLIADPVNLNDIANRLFLFRSRQNYYPRDFAAYIEKMYFTEIMQMAAYKEFFGMLRVLNASNLLSPFIFNKIYTLLQDENFNELMEKNVGPFAYNKNYLLFYITNLSEENLLTAKNINLLFDLIAYQDLAQLQFIKEDIQHIKYIVPSLKFMSTSFFAKNDSEKHNKIIEAVADGSGLLPLCKHAMVST